MSTPNLARAVLEALSAEGVEFVVCGGVAVVLQGVPRMTHDLDLRVDLADANLVSMGGHLIPVSCKADLIVAKRAVQPPRKVDLRDIEDLEELIRAGR